jgi:hypothetical protein
MEALTMNDGNGMAEAFMGSTDSRFSRWSETPEELIVKMETMATMVGSRSLDTRAERRAGKRPIFGIWLVSVVR